MVGPNHPILNFWCLDKFYGFSEHFKPKEPFSVKLWSKNCHHHHLAASAEIAFTTPFQYSLSCIAPKRFSSGISVSRFILSGKVSFRERFFDDGCLQRTNNDTSSSEARAQCPANWTRLHTRVDTLGKSLYIISSVGWFLQERLRTLIKRRV